MILEQHARRSRSDGRGVEPEEICVLLGPVSQPTDLEDGCGMYGPPHSQSATPVVPSESVTFVPAGSATLQVRVSSIGDESEPRCVTTVSSSPAP